MAFDNRTVYASFSDRAHLGDRKMIIKKRGSVLQQVEAQLDAHEKSLLVGVLNQDKTTWID